MLRIIRLTFYKFDDFGMSEIHDVDTIHLNIISAKFEENLSSVTVKLVNFYSTKPAKLSNVEI